MIDIRGMGLAGQLIYFIRIVPEGLFQLQSSSLDL